MEESKKERDPFTKNNEQEGSTGKEGSEPDKEKSEIENQNDFDNALSELRRESEEVISKIKSAGSSEEKGELIERKKEIGCRIKEIKESYPEFADSAEEEEKKRKQEEKKRELLQLLPKEKRESFEENLQHIPKKLHNKYLKTLEGCLKNKKRCLEPPK